MRGVSIREGLIFSIALLALEFGCSLMSPSDDDLAQGTGKEQGTEGSKCFPNSTCLEGLVCLSHLCVVAGTVDSGTADSAPAVQEGGDVATDLAVDLGIPTDSALEGQLDVQADSATDAAPDVAVDSVVEVSVDSAGDVGSGADADSQPNIVFVTSATFAASIQSLSAADGYCQAAAQDGGLPGEYVAFLGNSTTTALSRLGGARGWVRPDGLPFSDTIQDIANGKIFYPPALDERGNLAPTAAVAWTGAENNGTSSGSVCKDWSSTSSSDSGSLGFAHAGRGLWAGSSFTGCSNHARLFCFGISHVSQVTVPSATGRLAFVTSAFPAISGGLAAADAFCQNEAVKGGLVGTYQAFLATTTGSAISRFDGLSGPWIRPDQVVIADTVQDLAKPPWKAPIDVKADGGYLGSTSVWTGAGGPGVLGTSASTCSDWTSSSSSISAVVGNAALSDRGFSWSTRSCDATTQPLYCLQVN